MVQSKAWNWKVAISAQWQNPAPEVYPLISRWQDLHLLNFLDLGCGVGRHSLLFADNGFTVTATDLSTDGLEKLKQIADEKKIKINFATSDMLALPFTDNSFDSLLAYHVIYHTDDLGIKKVISEIHRVLAQNGEAFITFNSQSGTSFKDKRNQHISANTIVKNIGHEAGIPHFYATKNDVVSLLKDFKIIEFSYKEEYWDSVELGQDYVGAHYCVLVKKI